MQREEKAFWNKDIARILEIGESTVRKWCIELEKNGYSFVRGHKDSRAFLQHDLNALTYFKDLTKVGSYTLEQAAKLVVERFGNREDSDITASVPGEERRSLHEIGESLKELIKLSKEQVELSREQAEINKELLKKIEERDFIIENQYRYIESLSEKQTLIEHHETRHNNDTNEDNEVKKKRPIERIKSIFKR